MDKLRIRLLGGFQVSVGDRVVDDGEWRLRKAKALVKLLALAPGHRLHREQTPAHPGTGDPGRSDVCGGLRLVPARSGGGGPRGAVGGGRGGPARLLPDLRLTTPSPASTSSR